MHACAGKLPYKAGGGEGVLSDAEISRCTYGRIFRSCPPLGSACQFATDTADVSHVMEPPLFTTWNRYFARDSCCWNTSIVKSVGYSALALQSTRRWVQKHQTNIKLRLQARWTCGPVRIHLSPANCSQHESQISSPANNCQPQPTSVCCVPSLCHYISGTGWVISPDFCQEPTPANTSQLT